MKNGELMLNYKIRKTKIDEMLAVQDVHRRSIIDLCCKDYNQEQIEKWSNVNYNKEIWETSIKEQLHLVVEIDHKIEGFCHSKIRDDGKGEIAGLYFSKKISGRGLGKKIFDESMDYLRKNGCTDFVVFATKTAKGFYEKMGFQEVDSCSLNIRGTELICIKMEMSS